MDGLMTFCHDARKGRYIGSHWPNHVRASALLDHSYCETAFKPTNARQRYCGRKCCIAEYDAENRDRVAKRKAAYYAANRGRIAAYYAANRARILKRQAAYRATNRARIAKQDAAYRAANRKRILKSAAAYYAANRARVLKRLAACRAANRDKVAKRKPRREHETRATHRPRRGKLS